MDNPTPTKVIMAELVGGSQDGTILIIQNPPERFAYRPIRTFWDLFRLGRGVEYYRRRPGTSFYDYDPQ